MQQPMSGHPWWCEYPNAPHDHTHSHTLAVGAVLVGADVMVDAVLTQPGDAAAPTVTMHLTGATVGVTITMQGREPWLLAGLMIDATVMLARATPGPVPAADAVRHDVAAGSGHPLASFGGRSPGRRRVRTVVRCVRYRDGGQPAAGRDPGPSR